MSGWYEFSPARCWAVVVKEFIQMRRDRLTFGMMIGIPLLQLILFGFAINSDPRHLPTAVLLADRGPQGRTLLGGDSQQQLLRLRPGDEVGNRGATRRWPAAKSCLSSASRKISAATFCAATGRCCSSRRTRPTPRPPATPSAPCTPSLDTALQNDLKGPLAYLGATAGPVELRVHAKYNPEAITQYNIVPGLMGVVLTLTMILITGLAITRERERGTMENLLSMPTRPFEVLLGKIVPYILVGYIQVGLILLAARFLFNVPMAGDIGLLLAATLIFIVANLAVGVTFSTLAKNQLQAMQMTFFFFLPSILLSGFMFPFRGMPVWAQVVGEVCP